MTKPATPQPSNLTIRLQRIERVQFSEFPPERAGFQPDQVNLQFQTTINVVAPEKSVRVLLKVMASLQPEGRELFQISTVHDFFIENFEKLPTRGKGANVQIDFPQELVLNLIANAYAGTRGILWQSLQQDAYRRLPLPLIDPVKLLPRNPNTELPS